MFFYTFLLDKKARKVSYLENENSFKILGSDHPGFDKGTGHFTQLMWNATTQVGMGHAIGNDGKVYITAR